MSEINSILSTLGDAVASDSTLAAWVASNYPDDSLSVFEHCDIQQMFEESDCPLVIIYPLQKDAGESAAVKTHLISIVCAVWDDDKEESAAGVVRFKGGRNVESMRQLVVDVVTINLPAGLHLQSISTEYHTIEEFPFVSLDMVLALTEEKLIGQDPFE